MRIGLAYLRSLIDYRDFSERLCIIIIINLFVLPLLLILGSSKNVKN